MKKAVIAAVLAFSGVSFAEGTQQQMKAPTAAQTAPAAQAGQMDFSKMGPWSRKPTNEKQTKKEIEAFVSDCEALQKKGDFQAAVAKVDFPVFMMTDNASGVVDARPWSKDEYVAMMKPMFEGMPKDMKSTHKTNITVLSDSIAVVVDDFTMTHGKEKYSGRATSQVIKKDGQWKWKSMTEAGWGNSANGTGGTGMTETQTAPHTHK